MDVKAYIDSINTAAQAIEACCGKAEIAVILGSGLGDFGNELKNAREIAYADIPGFPHATVKGHAGKLICGELVGKQVMMMSGRFHSYEGHPMEDVTLPIRVMARLGVKNLIVTNAAGGVNLSFSAGCLMMITDFINLSGKNPLVGENLDEFGPRFPDMSNAYDKDLRALALSCARELKIDLKQGVYCWMSGPCYETPAEIRMTRILGADAVGMSTVPEVITAAHCGMQVLGFSLCTNMAAGVTDVALDGDEVIAAGQDAMPRFANLLRGCLKRL